MTTTPDRSDDWPAVGVRRDPARASAGADALRALGFGQPFDVDPIEADRDRWQDHLNNGAVVRMFNELRVAWVLRDLSRDWTRWVRDHDRTVVVRELHVSYEREGWMHERFVGGVRIAERRGRAAIMEQILTEAESGSVLARCWIVQLVVGPDGRVVAYPDFFWSMLEAVQGAAVPEVDAPRVPWGPPA